MKKFFLSTALPAFLAALMWPQAAIAIERDADGPTIENCNSNVVINATRVLQSRNII